MPFKTRYVFIVSMDVAPDKEALFNEVYDEEHVPYLMEVPIVGELFKGRDDDHEATELLIMITPTIIDGDHLVTSDYQYDTADRGFKQDKDYTDFDYDPAHAPEYSKEEKEPVVWRDEEDEIDFRW